MMTETGDRVNGEIPLFGWFPQLFGGLHSNDLEKAAGEFFVHKAAVSSFVSRTAVSFIW